jgi:Domain of unknown function (DUF4136)
LFHRLLRKHRWALQQLGILGADSGYSCGPNRSRNRAADHGVMESTRGLKMTAERTARWARATRLGRITVLGTIFVCISFAAASAQQVRANWSRNAPFSEYKTYQWIPSEATNHPFYRQYVGQYVNYALQKKKHLQEVSASQNPDLYVTYHFTTREVMDTETYGYGFGPGWGGWGWGGWGWGGWGWGGPNYYQTRQIPRVMGYLTLDLIDARTKKIVWRGEAIQADVTKGGHAEEKQVANSVYKMLKRYPPKEK